MSLCSHSLQLLSTYSLTPLSGIYPYHSTKIVCIKGMDNFHTAKHNGQLVVLILINLSVSFDTIASISSIKSYHHFAYTQAILSASFTNLWKMKYLMSSVFFSFPSSLTPFMVSSGLTTLCHKFISLVCIPTIKCRLVKSHYLFDICTWLSNGYSTRIMFKSGF